MLKQHLPLPPQALRHRTHKRSFRGRGKNGSGGLRTEDCSGCIGLGEVAEASVVTPTEIMVNGKTAGETSLIIWDIHGGRQFFNVTVRNVSLVSSDSLDSIRREIKNRVAGQAVKVSYDNNTVFLRGTVDDLTGSERAVRLPRRRARWSTSRSETANFPIRRFC